MEHYNKYNKIEMDIFRNGELIGYNYYFFTKKGNETTVTNQINFSVKDPDILLPEIIQVLTNSGIKIQKIESTKSSLEDVFLDLTGKRLNE